MADTAHVSPSASEPTPVPEHARYEVREDSVLRALYNMKVELEGISAVPSMFTRLDVLVQQCIEAVQRVKVDPQNEPWFLKKLASLTMKDYACMIYLLSTYSFNPKVRMRASLFENDEGADVVCTIEKAGEYIGWLHARCPALARLAAAAVPSWDGRPESVYSAVMDASKLAVSKFDVALKKRVQTRLANGDAKDTASPADAEKAVTRAVCDVMTQAIYAPPSNVKKAGKKMGMSSFEMYTVSSLMADIQIDTDRVADAHEKQAKQ